MLCLYFCLEFTWEIDRKQKKCICPCARDGPLQSVFGDACITTAPALGNIYSDLEPRSEAQSWRLIDADAVSCYERLGLIWRNKIIWSCQGETVIAFIPDCMSGGCVYPFSELQKHCCLRYPVSGSALQVTGRMLKFRCGLWRKINFLKNMSVWL